MELATPYEDIMMSGHFTPFVDIDGFYFKTNKALKEENEE